MFAFCYSIVIKIFETVKIYLQYTRDIIIRTGIVKCSARSAHVMSVCENQLNQLYDWARYFIFHP